MKLFLCFKATLSCVAPLKSVKTDEYAVMRSHCDSQLNAARCGGGGC